jgi:hypothetical protein
MIDMIFLFPQYLLWHYTKGIQEAFKLCYRIEAFIFHFFSVPLLFKTLFAPFERLNEGYKKGLDVGNWAGTFIVNTIMRFVGMLVRLFFIVLAVVCGVVWVGIGGALFIVWLVAPFLMLALLALAGVYATKLLAL